MRDEKQRKTEDEDEGFDANSLASRESVKSPRESFQESRKSDVDRQLLENDSEIDTEFVETRELQKTKIFEGFELIRKSVRNALNFKDLINLIF